jgi:gamma-glutamyltranspeptidase/glutathione hydrolase
VRTAFYDGPIAEAIDAFHIDNNGLIRKSDLSNYSGEWEQPQSGRFGEYEILTNGPWSQGMTLSMALNILYNVDLKSMGRNSGLYIHTVTQAIELAMSDREAYFGDPNFVDVPEQDLLSDSYGSRRHLSMSDQAFSSFPDPINIEGHQPFIAQYSSNGPRDTKTVGDDTSQIIVADSSGNLIAITPSDFPMTPMIPEWDLTLGNRMNQFRLNEDHPASLQPGKRPRVTPQAVMIRKKDAFYMSINTPGGDNQIQAMLQVLLNHIIWGDDIQKAIERPRFMTLGFPGSFAPHIIKPATLEVEENIPGSSIQELKALGYTVKIIDRWGIAAGIGAIIKDQNQYLIGADPRAETIALGK